MAARLRKTHQDEVRTKIQASQLINVLQNHALGIEKEGTKELSASRLKAIEILLKKSMPDLSQVTAICTTRAKSRSRSIASANDRSCITE